LFNKGGDCKGGKLGVWDETLERAVAEEAYASCRSFPLVAHSLGQTFGRRWRLKSGLPLSQQRSGEVLRAGAMSAGTYMSCCLATRMPSVHTYMPFWSDGRFNQGNTEEAEACLSVVIAILGSQGEIRGCLTHVS
jgi:hypothetical protein